LIAFGARRSVRLKRKGARAWLAWRPLGLSLDEFFVWVKVTTETERLRRRQSGRKRS